jgi:5-methyltetrahydrofolate--homocysteine methyltransferase
MTWKDFYEKARDKIAFSDGSMGVFLQKYGLSGEDCPELWNVERSDIVFNVHQSYVEAGADLIITNTLGGNRVKLADYKLENRVEEINAAAVKLARKAAGRKAIVAGDIGPAGPFIEPIGRATFNEMVDIYKEQVLALANAGADCIFFETHIDILDLKAGIIACREACDLPIIASMTFEKDGRTVTGSSPEAVFTALEALGVDMIGTNCGTGPSDMLSIIQKIEGLFSVPFIAQANAGMPKLIGGRTVFNESPESYVVPALKMIEHGVNAIGGCCGTTPDHIRLMRDRALELKSYIKRNTKKVDFLKLASRYRMHKIGFDLPFTVIGERLNPTARKALSKDITGGQFAMFKDEALNQEKAGAHILDLNMGIPGANEALLIKQGLEILSTSIQVPVAIDSSNPEAASLGMRLYPGKPVLNSITAEKERLALLKDVKKYGAAFIALPIDEKGIPKTAEARVTLMRKIVAEAEKLGIDKKNILADPLVLTVSAEQEGAAETLRTIRLYKEELGLFTTMGLSNVSFGLPARGYVNRNFLSMAIANGLTSAIANPFDEELMGMVRASDVLLGRDIHSQNYVEYYAGKPDAGNKTASVSGESPQKKTDTVAADETIENKLKQAVLKGSRTGIEGYVREALEKGMKAYDILNSHLIPAITEVGRLYEQRTYFLPQLMLSAETMKVAFTVLEPLLKESSSKPKGRIILATVKGDVHDIGKNIVILMLRNNGYDVIDLGKDIPNEVILEEAKKNRADIVGLSALMTTTMPRMEEFTALIKKENLSIHVMVGGAAVTRTFAESIGAHYSTDAVDAVRVASELLKK